MTILECKRLFKKELSEIYTESESAAICGVFLYEKTGFDAFQQRRFSQQALLQSDEEEFLDILQQLKTKKPYQQILGHTEFYGSSFWIDENVLIPRPETEELLEMAIDKIQKSKLQKIKILDIGTGSGIIPITLKKHFPDAHISAMDISEKALEIAQKNAAFHQTEIHFILADYLHTALEEKYDLIISNPPYIGQEEQMAIEDSVKGFEPHIALFAPTEDALIFYKKIAHDCRKNLNQNGWYFLEINQKLGKETLALFHDFQENTLVKDLSGNERFVMGRK